MSHKNPIQKYVIPALTLLVLIVVLVGVMLTVNNQTISLDSRSDAIDACGGRSFPVCGSDGKTYFNTCQARTAGVMTDCNGRCPCAATAYFQYRTAPLNPANDVQITGVLKLTEPAKIEQARNLLRNNCYAVTTQKADPKPACDATIIRTQVFPNAKGVVYNKPWNFATEPLTTTFISRSPEVCDLRIQDVQKAVLGGKALGPQGNTWCPWQFQLVKEVAATDAVK